MGRDPLDKQLKDSLEKGTDDAMQYKDEIWTSIKERIHSEPAPQKAESEAPFTPRESKVRRRPRRRAAGWIVGTAAAAAIVFAVSFQTVPVQAFIDQVKEWFAPEKTVEQELEGMPETSVDSLHEGADYVIYIDESRFKMVHGADVDRIELKEKPTDDRYPEVFMEISQEGIAPKAAAERIQGELQDYPKVESNLVEEPVQGWEVRAIGGTGGKEWDDPVVRYYVFDNGQGGSFVVKQQYFLEASEGFGVRFRNMMEEFHITSNTNTKDDKE
ncbi:hypothetical protein [Paenibacillus sp. Cedars]|uniref:hypothetical protein n=1 Tax=Paenibacillus sp. Cedars TaxID=1980674 RepID=UPI00116335F9|nr:hypothetical protein [Paenibacillus sp. Cedars]AWP29858.1 hypothetical protein B9D94_26015 [Paenibacillus sp. Cedars]